MLRHPVDIMPARHSDFHLRHRIKLSSSPQGYCIPSSPLPSLLHNLQDDPAGFVPENQMISWLTKGLAKFHKDCSTGFLSQGRAKLRVFCGNRTQKSMQPSPSFTRKAKLRAKYDVIGSKLMKFKLFITCQMRKYDK